MISARARDLIIEAEFSDKKTYQAKYRRPEWPGGNSGVTVGIGYDLGMQDREKMTDDWQAHVPAAMLKAMQSCAGISGQAANVWKAPQKEFMQFTVQVIGTLIVTICPG